jgi:hypothetical protein
MINAVTKTLGMLPGYKDLQDVITTHSGSLSADFNIVFAGEFNAGKSMLINALLGRDLLKSTAVPTTARVTHVQYGLQEHVRVKRCNGSESDYPIEYLEKLTTAKLDVAAEDDVGSVIVSCNAELLEPHKVFIDTPGFGDDQTQIQQSQAALQAADLIVWVLRATDALKQRERQRAQEWLSDNPEVLVAPVLNFMNCISADSRKIVRQRLSGMLATMLRERAEWVTAVNSVPFFEIDIQSALDNALRQPSEPERGFSSLLQLFMSLKPHNCKVLKARGHRARTKRKLEHIQRKLESQFTSFKTEANTVQRAKEDREKARHADERRLSSRADGYLASLEREIEDQFEKTEQELCDWLNGKTLSALYRSRINERWTHNLLNAVKIIRLSTTIACNSLILESCGPHHKSHVPISFNSISFCYLPPSPGVYDSLRNLVGMVPTDGYLSEVKLRLRREWARCSSEIVASAREAIRLHCCYLWEAIRQRYEADILEVSLGWKWCISEDLVAIKSQELWLGRGAPATQADQCNGFLSKVKRFIVGQQDLIFIDGPHDCDQQEAKQQLTLRLQAGEPLFGDLLQCELANTILESHLLTWQHGAATNLHLNTDPLSAVH